MIRGAEDMPLAEAGLSPRITLRARYVFPIIGEPIADGAVTVENGRIVRVGRAPAPSAAVEDLGNVAVLPGLINAHVHLNFSDLTVPLGYQGISTVAWIRHVIQWLETAATDAGAHADTIAHGIQESLRGGVTTLAEIAQPHWPIDGADRFPANIVLFQEVIAPTEQRTAQAVRLANAFLQAVPKQFTEKRLRVGLSPHAPYSVHPSLLTEVVRIANERRSLVAMHLAESREELEFLSAGSGPFRDLLENIGAWDPTLVPRGARPLDYLRQLARVPKALVIHGNYLNDEEISFLAANNGRMSAIYCPRTHAWFDHDPYPLQKMLAAGVQVALGTDGRGSAPNLSLLEDIRCAAVRHADVPPAQLLQLATLGGARALGLDHDIGSLEPGKWADLTVIPLPNHAAVDPHELLLELGTLASASYVRGHRVFP